MFLIENECKAAIECLIFIFYQKYFLWWNGVKGFILMWLHTKMLLGLCSISQ